MSQSAELVVEDRVKQLQEISKRREQLLREMYHLLHRREKLGSVPDIDEEDESMQMFLDRFDLVKNPESGQISNLPDTELFVSMSPPSSEEVFEDGEPKTADALESPISETPGYPSPGSPLPASSSPVPHSPVPPSPSLPSPPPAGTTDVDTENLQYPEPEPTNAAPLETDEHAPQPVTTEYPTDEDIGSDDILILGPQPQKNGARRKSKPAFRHLLQTSDEEYDELDLIGRRRSRPITRDASRAPEIPHVSPSASPALPSVKPVSAAATIPSAPHVSPPAEPSPTQVVTSLAAASPTHLTEEDLPAEPADTASPMEVMMERVEEPPYETPEYEDVHDQEQPEAFEEMVFASQHEQTQEDVSAVPRISLGTSEQTVASLLRFASPVDELPIESTEPKVLPQYVVLAPVSPLVEPDYDADLTLPEEPPAVNASAVVEHTFVPRDYYTLPPLSKLAIEFNRKGKPARQQRRREKEREKNGGERLDGKKEEWIPMGINRWGAELRANPLWKRMSKASKYLSTQDWNIAITELRLIRTLERIEMLKEAGQWSFRQPKKQRGVGGLTKTHWDFLMDEMRWMRIDFREERRWKTVLAFNIAQAVMDWHTAGTLEERVRRGICVLWKPPRPEDPEEMDAGANLPDADIFMESQGTEEEPAADSGETNTPANDYGSDDESEDEQEKEPQDVFDVLAPTIALEEALNAQEAAKVAEADKDFAPLKPKLEDIEDLTALRNAGEGEGRDAMDVDDTLGQKQDTQLKVEEFAGEVQTKPSGLKPTSQNPVLGKHVMEGTTPHTSQKSKSRYNVYAPLREQILYSEVDKLFIDYDDVDVVKAMAALNTEDHSMSAPPPPPDLSAIFPDLQPYGLLDVPAPSSSGTAENRKKSEKKAEKDDPNKRAEDTTYTKLVTLNEFMHTKPTLLGALEPAKHWKDGEWYDLDETPVAADTDSSTARILDDSLCGLFDGSKPNSVSIYSSLLPKDKERKRSDHSWSIAEDTLLQQIVEKYPHNWPLIADTFNSSRVTISTDKRTVLDCFERFSARWRPVHQVNDNMIGTDDEIPPSSQPAPTQMTTRGHRRSVSISVAAAASNSAAQSGSGAEPKKRRRRALIQEAIRKANKKKEAAQKTIAMQRKPAAIHDTHGHINKMPNLSPQELGRMKAEKEARNTREEELRRRSDVELARHQQLMQAQRMQNAQQQQAQQQQSQQQAVPNGISRTTGSAIAQPPAVAQMRPQVGISQQQRLSNPMLANARMSPSQMIHVQAQAQAQVRALAHVQVAQAQAQLQAAGSNALSAAAPALSAAHLSPAYAGRAASSSPAIPQQSPQLQPAAANLSRPSSAQMTAPSQAVSVTAAARPSANMNQYYMQNVHTAQLTQEQMEHALRLQNLIRQQAQQHAGQLAQTTQAAQNAQSHNGIYHQQS